MKKDCNLWIAVFLYGESIVDLMCKIYVSIISIGEPKSDFYTHL